MLDTDEDRLTFTQIYEDLRLFCYHAALAITKNPAMSEDAVHNAFLSVIKHKDKIFALSREKRKSQIVIIAKNKAIDLMRAQNKYAPPILDEHLGEVDAINEFDLSHILESREAFEHLIDCINSLPEIYKTAFELMYLHEMSNKEIAELLDISASGVSMRLARAKTMLREKLAEGGGFNG